MTRGAGSNLVLRHQLQRAADLAARLSNALEAIRTASKPYAVRTRVGLLLSGPKRRTLARIHATATDALWPLDEMKKRQPPS